MYIDVMLHCVTSNGPTSKGFRHHKRKSEFCRQDEVVSLVCTQVKVGGYFSSNDDDDGDYNDTSDDDDFDHDESGGDDNEYDCRC